MFNADKLQQIELARHPADYDAERPLILKIFNSVKSFIEHFEKHVLSKSQPWAEHFPAKKLAEWRQKARKKDVSYVEEAYAATVEYLKSAMAWSVSHPLYATYEEEVLEPHPYCLRDCMLMITEDGCKIACHGSAVRTMHYMDKFAMYQGADRRRRAVQNCMRRLNNQVKVEGGKEIGRYRNVQLVTPSSWARNRQEPTVKRADWVGPDIEQFLQKIGVDVKSNTDETERSDT